MLSRCRLGSRLRWSVRFASNLVSVGIQGEQKVLVLKPEIEYEKVWDHREQLVDNLVRRRVYSDAESASDAVESLRQRWEELKEQKKRVELREQRWALEEDLLTKLIHLPNSLHETVADASEITGHFCVPNPWEKPVLGESSELDVGFLLRDWMRVKGYQPWSPSDTVTADVAEAVYGPHYFRHCWQLEKQHLFLPGSASLAAMCSVFARRMTKPHVALPLKVFSTGNVYPTSAERNFSCSALIFGQETSGDHGFEVLLADALEVLTRFGLNVRVVSCGVPLLEARQMRRVDLQVLGGTSDEWKRVGHVEECSDYLSRRLLMKSQVRSSKQEVYLNVAYSTLSLTSLLPILEMNKTTDA